MADENGTDRKNGGDSNVIDSVKEAWNERLKHPLIAPFLLSWCVVNWPILVAAYDGGDGDVSRHVAISRAIDAQRAEDAANLFFAPAGIAIIATFVLPLVDIPLHAVRGLIGRLNSRINLSTERAKASDKELAERARVAADIWADLSAREILAGLAERLKVLDVERTGLADQTSRIDADLEDLHGANEAILAILARVKEPLRSAHGTDPEDADTTAWDDVHANISKVSGIGIGALEAVGALAKRTDEVLQWRHELNDAANLFPTHEGMMAALRDGVLSPPAPRRPFWVALPIQLVSRFVGSSERGIAEAMPTNRKGE